MNQISDTMTRILGQIFVQLASNNLSGDIPEQLIRISKHNFTGNQLNCGTKSFPPCASVNAGRKSKSKTDMIVGITIPLLAIILLGCYLLLVLRKDGQKGSKREVYVDVEGEVDRRIAFGQLKRFAWRELQLATDDFSEENVLGQGGFGKVYQGVLADNTKVAVKCSTDFKSPGGDTAFQCEVEMISVAIHRNLLRLIGFCTTPTERLLVYPFMQNLSVAARLRGVNVNLKNNAGQTALHLSSSSKSTGMIKSLIAFGANVSTMDKIPSGFGVFICSDGTPFANPPKTSNRSQEQGQGIPTQSSQASTVHQTSNL